MSPKNLARQLRIECFIDAIMVGWQEGAYRTREMLTWAASLALSPVLRRRVRQSYAGLHW